MPRARASDTRRLSAESAVILMLRVPKKPSSRSEGRGAARERRRGIGRGQGHQFLISATGLKKNSARRPAPRARPRGPAARAQGDMHAAALPVPPLVYPPPPKLTTRDGGHAQKGDEGEGERLDHFCFSFLEEKRMCC